MDRGVRQRKKTRQVKVATVPIGGNAPVSIQSMTSVPLEDRDATIRQVAALSEAGADIVRIAMLNEEAAGIIPEIKKAVDVPLTADVHFNYRIALAAMRNGIDKVRINPGNIGGSERVKEVVSAAKERKIPIRIGVNSGSIDRKRFPEVTPESMVESALDHVRILEENDFHDIVVSLKSSDLSLTMVANRLFPEHRDYPLHIGLTEAGYGLSCVVQSSIALGNLLLEGIGDTLRVSMTGDPVEEVAVAKKILEAVGERRPLVRLIACPTCGRTSPDIDIPALARRAEEAVTETFAGRLAGLDEPLTVAVMGCEVNGPGEAGEAHIGLAGGRDGNLLLFAKGEKVRKVSPSEAIEALLQEIKGILG